MDILDILTNTWSMPMYLGAILGILFLTLLNQNFRLNRKIKAMLVENKSFKDWSHELYNWVVKRLP